MRSRSKEFANLIKSRRIELGISQFELEKALLRMDGKKGTGQYLSNVERGLCQFPPKRLHTLCSLLDLDVETVKDAMVKDYRHSLNLLLDGEIVAGIKAQMVEAAKSEKL